MPCVSNTVVWIVRESARPLANRLASFLGARVLPNLEEFSREEATNRELFCAEFPQATHWVLVMAAGIATRYLAGLPQSKQSDPAVVVVDEACRFAVALLSGHEGGANALAYRIAIETGATPVITTATEALKPLTLGIGCRRGVSSERVHSAVQNALESVGRSLGEVREVATVDLKKDENGLLEWVAEKQLPMRVFSRSQLAQRPWTANPSSWVQSNIGLSAVCEPCALLASPRGVLLVPKFARAGVTVAVVSDELPPNFFI